MKIPPRARLNEMDPYQVIAARHIHRRPRTGGDMSKEYHFGVVAYFDEDTSTWEFQAQPINGDDSPFAEMSWGEVYDPDEGDVSDPGWQFAIMDSDDPVEAENYERLMEAIRHAEHRLREPQT